MAHRAQNGLKRPTGPRMAQNGFRGPEWPMGPNMVHGPQNFSDRPVIHCFFIIKCELFNKCAWLSLCWYFRCLIICSNPFNLFYLFLYLCSLSQADSYSGRHPAGPDLASFVYLHSCPAIGATLFAIGSILFSSIPQLPFYQSHLFCWAPSTPLCWYRPRVPPPTTHGNPDPWTFSP